MKALKIGNIELKSNVILAPLAGITNLSYREFIKEFDCGLVVSEMISDFALIYNNKETVKMLQTSSFERPVSIQLFGGSKDSILKALPILEAKADYDILDINLGCPVPKVVKENAGSAWLKKGREQELFEMMSEVVKISSKPVTAKIRIGWSEESINVCDTVLLLEKAGISAITIHGRTRNQMYLGSANYELIKKAKDLVSIPIIANGDITTLDKALEVLDYTKADGIMIGRGSLGNPFLVKQISHYLKTGERLLDPSPFEQIRYLRHQFQKLVDLKGEEKALRESRGLSSFYLKGFPNAKYFKAKLTQVKTIEEFYNIINLLEGELHG